jgi:hypothetical protein
MTTTTPTTMIAVPTSCTALCTRLAELAQRIDDEIAQTGSGAAIDYGAVEQRIADALGAFERGLHAQILARLDIDVPAIRVWGDEYRRIGRFESDYHTLAGTVRVMRSVYRKTERNGNTLDPVSVRAGVVADGWLPHTARAMAHMLAQGTSREAEATARELARLPYSRSSFERVGHEVGTLYRRAQPRIEEALIQAYAVPADARSVSISIDRVALPMEEPIEAPPVPVDPPWVAAALATAPPPTPQVQAVLDEIELAENRREDKIARNFRMAYAATVTLHDAEGDALHTIRYGRMPKGDVRGLCRGLVRDVTAMRAQRPDLKVAYLTDGATEFETLYAQHLATPLGSDVVSLIDFWHAAEYLGAAARVFEIKRKAGPGQFRRWRHALKHDDGAGAQIVEQLEQSGLDKVTLDGVRPVEAAIRYFRARLPRMAYAAARREGLPIGSGNVEATCKSLVTVRMKRPGARWKHATGDEVLQLRALQLSDRWAPAVQRALKPLAKSVQIVGGLGLRAAANTNRSATPIANRRSTIAAA